MFIEINYLSNFFFNNEAEYIDFLKNKFEYIDLYKIIV